MVRESHRTRFTGSSLARLLAQPTHADDALPSKHAFSRRLSEWFDWTDAVSLAAALDDGSNARPRRSASVSFAAIAAEAARVRDTLARSIVEDFGPRIGRPPHDAPVASEDTKADLAIWRRRYVGRQQSMETGICAARGRVREAMAKLSPGMARLAAVDEVMQQVLGDQERVLLSIVPKWLEQRFQRLESAPAPAPNGGPSPSGHGIDVLRQEMHDVLHAELEFRWQPVEGLLEALRSVATDRNE